MQLPRSYHQEYKVHQNLGQNAEYAPLPRAIQKEHAPGADKHPDVVGVNQREHQDVRLALVVGSVAAPAGALVKELFPSMYRCGLDDGVLVQVVADLGAGNLHHLVDEHVVVAAGKIHQVAKTAYGKEQVFFIGEACGRCHNWVTPAESGCFHGCVAQGFQFLVKVGERTAAVILLGSLYNADAVGESACHGGNPALAGNAVGVHGQKHIVFCDFEGAFQGAFLGACNLGQIRRKGEYLEFRMGGGEFFQDFAGGIGGTVVYANHFPFAHVILFGKGFQGALREFFFVTHGDHYRNAGRGLGAPVSVCANNPYYEE